jgi:hypothetical protein
MQYADLARARVLAALSLVEFSRQHNEAYLEWREWERLAEAAKQGGDRAEYTRLMRQVYTLQATFVRAGHFRDEAQGIR